MRHWILRLLIASLGIGLVVPALAGGGPVGPGLAFVDVDERDDQPDRFTLSAAYPNPFNPTTSFSLSVEERQEVTVDVFNLLGVHVKRLFQGVMEAEEPRSFTFTADGLPSGIYLYRVQGADFTATRQMTLLK